MFKKALKKIIPRNVLLTYHKALAVAANVWYWFPSRKMIVIGVTGTKGKSSTVIMITRILEEAGYNVGSTNTVFFKVGEREWANDTKQGMPGRFALQKLLRQMVSAGCTHAVVEVTSEGIVQHREWGIAFDVAVFTNLSPEHIDSHGSYASYRRAKERIFETLSRQPRKTARDGKAVKKVIVANRDEDEAEYFLRHQADEKWGVCGLCKDACERAGEETLCASDIRLVEGGTGFTVEDKYIRLPIYGAFMARNALLAIAAARALGLSLSVCEQALEILDEVPGRVQVLELSGSIRAIIDYAHEPRSFAAIFETARSLAAESKIIAVFGVTGGGRDTAKRPVMGKIASVWADMIILTTDDPYDDDPASLVDAIAPGIASTAAKEWQEGKNWWRIVDRKQAIAHALSLAGRGDVVLLLGKGSEQVMALANGKMIPWSDRETVLELSRDRAKHYV